MAVTPPPGDEGATPSGTPGVFPANLVGFVRLLRRSGVRCGAGASIDALRAVEAVGVARRDDVFWALHAVLVTRREDHEVFRRAFEVFWQAPATGSTALGDLFGSPRIVPPARPRPGQRRVAPRAEESSPQQPRRDRAGDELDIVVSWSDQEVFRHRDFEQMGVEEMEAAQRIVADMKLDLPLRRTRRWKQDPRRGRVDLRRTLRASLRSGHGTVPLQWSRRETGPLDLVILCDISGSMERYARVMLHFAHALTGLDDRVHTFLFGTRMTNVTRQLRGRDVDAALEAVGRVASDWSGGTRIGASLGTFNRLWSRRVLGRGAVVLMVTDGLDREGARGITREAGRLRRSCRRLIWLNPLLRYEGFEPRAAGIRALMEQVDEHRPIHNLESLDQLVVALSPRQGSRRVS